MSRGGLEKEVELRQGAPGHSEPMGATLLGKTWRAAESCLMLAEIGNKLGVVPCKFEARRGPRAGKAAGTTDALLL